MNKTTDECSPEAGERAVRIVLDSVGPLKGRRVAIVSNASKFGWVPQPLNAWFEKVEADNAQRGGITTEQAEKMNALEREARDLKHGSSGSPIAAYFNPSGTSRQLRQNPTFTPLRKDQPLPKTGAAQSRFCLFRRIA